MGRSLDGPSASSRRHERTHQSANSGRRNDDTLREGDDSSSLFPTGTGAGTLLRGAPVIGPLVRLGDAFGTRAPGTPLTRGPENNQAGFRSSTDVAPGNAGEGASPTTQPLYEPSAGSGGSAPRRAGGAQRRLRSARSSLRIPLLGGTSAAASAGTGLIIR